MRARYHTSRRDLALFARSVRQELYYEGFSDALGRFLEALTHQDDSGVPIPALQGTVLAPSAVVRGLALCRYYKNYSQNCRATMLQPPPVLTLALAPALTHTLPLSTRTATLTALPLHTTHTHSDDADVRTSDAFFSLFSDLAGRYHSPRAQLSVPSNRYNP